MTRSRRFVALALAAALGLAGCSGGGDAHRAKEVRAARSIGAGEGTLTLVAWNGYTEDGGDDPRVDWLTPFENQTKCKVGVRYASNTAEMLKVMSDPKNHFDGIAAPPEIAGRLIADRQVAPINTDLVDGYKDLDRPLREQFGKDGRTYGVPYVWGANLLMYDKNAVGSDPDSWAAIFDPKNAKKYAGKIVVRDSPLTLGDVALYLKSHRRKLHIKDPFALTGKQLAAAADLLTKQRPMVHKYWLNPIDSVGAFASGEAVIGQAWPYQQDVLSRGGRPVGAVAPREGATGWTDAWMLGARAEHTSCMYQWLSWTASPWVQQQVASWVGVAPANPQACGRGRLGAQFCSAYHVGDRSYLDKLVFSRTPAKDCGTKNSDDSCTDYADWTRAWQEATHQLN